MGRKKLEPRELREGEMLQEATAEDMAEAEEDFDPNEEFRTDENVSVTGSVPAEDDDEGPAPYTVEDMVAEQEAALGQSLTKFAKKSTSTPEENHSAKIAEILEAERAQKRAERQRHVEPVVKYTNWNDPALSEHIDEREVRKTVKDVNGDWINIPIELEKKVKHWLNSHGATVVQNYSVRQDGVLTVVSDKLQKQEFWLKTGE